MPSRTFPNSQDPEGAPKDPKRLILCFDGTGNSFQGNTGDTNIVKIYDMLDRADPKQMHYYQPGIGTYGSEGASVNAGLFGRVKRAISRTVDTGLATTFDSHVIAGYRFLMRYYSQGDRIYIFGFSRGAFTARFLARMVSALGLLSMGNEELVPFIFKLYQDYELGNKTIIPLMNTFSTTFCRHANREDYEHTQKKVPGDAVIHIPSGIKVHFLGLFDTVGSVGTLDIPWTDKMSPPPVKGTAEHVRHAVATDERRVKFKAALLAQDKSEIVGEDIKEVWFPGNHGDIGGGWNAEEDEKWKTMTFWERLWDSLKFKKTEEPSEDKKKDLFQLSDIALKWMVDELVAVEADDENKLAWNANKDDFMERFTKKQRERAVVARIHDTMVIGGGSSLAKNILWNFMEWIPFFIKRWEYYPNEKNPWQYVSMPPNGGGCRDIPASALFHHALIERMHRMRPSKERNRPYTPHNDVNFHPHERELLPAKLRRWILYQTAAESIDLYQIDERDDRTGAGSTEADYLLPKKKHQPFFEVDKKNTLKGAGDYDRILKLTVPGGS